MISITKAGIKDVELLARIGSITLIESHGHSAPPHVMQSYVDEKFSVNWITQEVNDPDNIFYLIHYNSQPVGYSKMVYNFPIEPVPIANITKLERLYVLQQFHDLQLGRRLLEFNIELSKQHAQQGIWLDVWKENHRAIRFYEKMGFKIVGDGMFRLTDSHANPNWQMFLSF